MEPAPSKFSLVLLALAVLPGYARAGQCGRILADAPSVQYVLNITFNGQQRCMAQVLVDRTLILEYDCYNEKVISEKQGLVTRNVSKHMKDTLKDVGDKMRRRRLDLKTRKTCRASSILQVGLECQSAASGTVCGPWEFRLDGQRFLVVYPKSGEYKADNSCGEEMKKMWENNEELNEFLKRTSEGDFTTWLEGLDRKKVLGTTDVPSIGSIFSVSASGPPWCEFLGTINGTPFFKYSYKTRMAEPVGPLREHLQGMMLNAMEACSQLVEHWKDLAEELHKALLANKQNISKAFDSLSLQGSMMCEQESNGRRKTFWEFGFKGQMCLRFDLKSRRWAELHPGCSSLKDTLDDNSDISRRLGWISNGNCVKLLNQSTVLNTKAAPTMATTTAPAPAPSKAVIIKDNIALILTLIFILLTLGI
ncbi:UL16 binding protein 2 [Phyllostomus discolor]|uniref:UL16 binding protein 2 n=1 Tax=Phyllostomus discolor TaxID=89673 RepID=A0A834ASN8_9CHIR|nr:UL16 binding protein 2 [Phyllostomus discolor]